MPINAPSTIVVANDWQGWILYHLLLFFQVCPPSVFCCCVLRKFVLKGGRLLKSCFDTEAQPVNVKTSAWISSDDVLGHAARTC